MELYGGIGHSESMMIHRPVGSQGFACQFDFVDKDTKPAYYYARGQQSNGQMAWSNPVYVG